MNYYNYVNGEKVNSAITYNSLKIGDVVFIDARMDWGNIGKYIQIIERGGLYPEQEFIPNYLGIVVEENEDLSQVKIIQASYLGVAITSLNKWIDQPKCNIIVKRYNDLFTDREKKQMKSWLKSKLKVSYDFLQLFSIVVRGLLLTSCHYEAIKYFLERLVTNPLDSKIKFVSSELVFDAYLEILHISIWTEDNPGFVTPWDIFRSKSFRTILKYFNFDYE